MLRRPARRRPGFTLLEVLLASVVGVILLGAVYASLDLTLDQIAANRRVIAASDLTRAVTDRIAADLTNTVGPLPAKSGGDTTAAGATAAAETTTATATATATEEVPASAVESGVNIPFGSGVVGTDKQLTVFVSRVPPAAADPAMAQQFAGNPTSDLTRIIYYLADGGAGLARQEQSAVTTDGVWNSSEPDRSNESADIITPEVKDITFEYYDGGSWLASWDGSATDIDGVSLVGPPRAIRVVLVLELPGRSQPFQKRVTHVIPIRAAVGNFVPETPVEDATTTTTTPTP